MSKKHKGEVEELKDFLRVTKHKEDSEEVAIINGKQFSVRIPRRFTDAAGVKPKVDSFKFRLVLPPPDSTEEPRLSGELIRG